MSYQLWDAYFSLLRRMCKDEWSTVVLSTFLAGHQVTDEGAR